MTTAIIERQTAVLLRGQQAWRRIKATAAEQRQLWREVGAALSYGKFAGNRETGQKFSDWVLAHFPGLDVTSEVADAIWFATNFRDGSELPAGMTHPSRIRQWLRDQDQTAPVNPAAVPDVEMAVATEVLRNHRRYKAALDHAKGTGPEADIAKRQVKATAKKLGVTEVALERLVDKLDPYGKLAPAHREGLRTFMDSVQDFTKHLRNTVANFDGVVTPEYLLAFIATELKG